MEREGCRLDVAEPSTANVLSFVMTAENLQQKGVNRCRERFPLRQYVREILNTARYQPCEDGPGFVAVVETLPVCMTQGRTLEDTRDLLIDAIETWLLSALKDGDPLPIVNDCRFAVAETTQESEVAYGQNPAMQPG
jgi:predicted RNase H-like HicB family nuclease